MRRHLVTPLAVVDLHGARRVDGEALVRVDGHAEETRVGLFQDTQFHTISHQKFQDRGPREWAVAKGHLIGPRHRLTSTKSTW